MMPVTQLGSPGGALVQQALVAVGAVVAILVGGELFTTGTEWLSKRFGLGESTTGSLVAALATTLPETLIPVLAIVQGSGASIGVGAILGGPVTLTTLALFVIGVTSLVIAARGARDRVVRADPDQTMLDLRVFLVGFGLAIAVGFLRGPWSGLVGVLLFGLYAWYLIRVLRRDDDGNGFDPEPLELGRIRGWIDGILGESSRDYRTDPSRLLVLTQVLVAAGLLLGGAHQFVEAITWLATTVFGVPSIIVALVLAPLVSNVPENVDGAIWVANDEDVLAIEQVTGTLAFQGTVVAAIGILFTPWDLSVAWGTADFLVAAAAVLSLLTGGYFYRRVADEDGTIQSGVLVALGLSYVAFIAVVGYYALAGFI